MTDFRILTRSETNSIYSTFSINEYEVDTGPDKEQIIKDFLKPENFKHEDFHKIIRHNEDASRNFLGHALNLEQITLSDFKKFNKNEALDFFDKDFKSTASTITREDKRLQVKFISTLTSVDSNLFYVISRNFFDTTLSYEVYFEDHKLLYDGIVYDAYFLVLWFTEENILNACEYISD